MKKNLYNIEPYVFNSSELNFDFFYQRKIEDTSCWVSNFEKKVKENLHTNKEVCALNSGTSAIHLALKMCSLEKDDVVFCSNFTFIASVNPILYEGAIPWLVDVDMTTGNMSPDYLEEAIVSCKERGKKPKAIVFTHSYGVPKKILEIKQIAEKYDLILIEDAAEAYGSFIEGKACGSIGDFGIISFNNNKISTTLGGGVLIVNNIETKNSIVKLANQNKETGRDYIHHQLGYNFRMPDVAAFLGTHQQQFLERELEMKKEIALSYQKQLDEEKNIDILFQLNEESVHQNYWMNCILFKDVKSKEAIVQVMEKNDVEVRGLWFPLNHQKFLKNAFYTGNNESLNLFQRGLCLPSGLGLTASDITKVIELVKNNIG